MQRFLATESPSSSQHHPHLHPPQKSIFDVKRKDTDQGGGGHPFRGDTTTSHSSTVSSIDALVDNEQGLLIIHPDVLISPTKVAEAIGCNRRGVLSDRVRSFGGTNEAAVMGNVKHAFIEAAVEMCLDRQAMQQQQQQPQQQQHQQQQHQYHLQQQQQQQSTNQPRPYPPPLPVHPTSITSTLITEQEIVELISACIASNLLDLMAVGLTDAIVESELRAGTPFDFNHTF